MMNFLSAFTQPLTAIFTLLMIVLFVWALRSKQGLGKQLSPHIPAFLTSLGILGTFTGIVISLINFDSANLRNSINGIISGMQTAFITSVIGVVLSLTLKFIQLKNSAKQQEKEKGIDEEGLPEIRLLVKGFNQQTESLSQLTEQNKALLSAIGGDSESSIVGQVKSLRLDLADKAKAEQEIVRKQVLALDKLTEQNQSLLSAIGSDGENSMLGQVRLLRLDLSEREQRNQTVRQAVEAILNQTASLPDLVEAMDNAVENMGKAAISAEKHRLLAESNQTQFSEFERNLNQQLQNFAEMLSRSATEQVIEALKEVIKDFNNRLTEQFGENFKQLNDAVGNLLNWQENTAVSLKK